MVIHIIFIHFGFIASIVRVIMRLLLITDSHGYEMEWELKAIRGSLDVFPMVLGRRTSRIRGKYRDELQEVINFDPQLVIMHMGHNDIVPHRIHNPRPLFVTAAFHQMMELAHEVSVNFPRAQMIISAMLPRGDGNGFTIEDARKYNRIARRFGQMLVKESYSDHPPIFMPVLNSNLWANVSQGVAERAMFDHGGLHLNTDGKSILANEWLDAIDCL
jgi:hypothetical protein